MTGSQTASRQTHSSFLYHPLLQSSMYGNLHDLRGTLSRLAQPGHPLITETAARHSAAQPNP